MQKTLRTLIFTLFMVLMSLPFLQAQTEQGIIRGFVYEEDSGEPMIFTNVFLEGTTYGAATDINGFFSINKVPPGTYMLLSTGIGYDTTKVEVTLKANQILNEKLFVGKNDIVLDVIEVGAAKQEARTEVRTSVIKITPKQINKIPAVGGEPDLAQYLQMLPGVVFTGDQGGQLYIRGGSQIQTRVLLDGITVYNPFHSIGLFSVFETDLIRNVEVMTGGFNAEY
ncbi:MAG: carboxypeptidase-like regulatory domain-containing protein, partial [Chitinophagales bacterium]